MAIITTNGSFGATAAVTSTTLNAVADAATFVSGAVDGTSLELISGGSDNGKLGIKDAGVTTAKVADSSSKTTGVTFAKMQHISTAKVLGRTSASEGDVEEVDLLDQDDMSSNSATSVATQQSIKAYVDAQDLTEYAMKYSGSTGTFSTTANTFVDLDLSAVVGSNRALVILEVYDCSRANSIFYRTKGSTLVPFVGGTNSGWGAASGTLGTSDNGGTVVVMTDENGIMQHRADYTSTGVKYTVQAYQKLA